MNPIIQNWTISPHKSKDGRWYFRLHGNIHGHPDYPRITDGEYCHTSEILSIDFRDNLVVTRSRTYQLGKPEPESTLNKAMVLNELTKA